MELEKARSNRDLVRIYREAFMWDRQDGVGPSQKRMLEDLEQFCGLRQAKFEGSEADMIKNLGRIEILGRINFFLNFPDDVLRNIEAVLEQAKENENE